jgi:hypothetical protein
VSGARWAGRITTKNSYLVTVLVMRPVRLRPVNGLRLQAGSSDTSQALEARTQIRTRRLSIDFEDRATPTLKGSREQHLWVARLKGRARIGWAP